MTIEIQRGSVVTVERGSNKVRAGQGLLKGLGVIWKHWVASFGKNDHYSKTHGTFTIEYPEERRELPDAYRNMPILLYDDATGHELCTSCFQCQRICPPQVIHMTQAKDPATGKPVPAVAEFLIEYDACMSCGFCAEVCPFDAIKMDHQYELATADHPSLTVDKRGLNRPVSYYERIAPALWAEAKESASKKLQGNMRRRSGSIGIAPQVADSRHETGDKRQERAGTQQTAAATIADAVVPAAPSTSTPTPAASDDKAARLAAIRAANAAKQSNANNAVEANPDTPASVTPDDKAARLAAIRAANAAKKTNVNDIVGAQQAGTSPTTDAIAPAAPSDDKAARLAAIRAANAAKKASADNAAGAQQAGTPPTVDKVAPAAPPMTDAAPNDKAARLAAIRAANAAKKTNSNDAVGAQQAGTPPSGDVVAPASPPPANETLTSPETTAAPNDKAARLAAIRAANAAKKAASAGNEGDDA